MAGKIKGITIEIGAETKGFKNGLKDLNKSSKDLQNELSAVNRALKHDPKNTELLRQKQELLTKSVEETKTKLDVLKRAKDKADRDMANGTEINQEEYRKLQREISFSETKLESLQKQTKEFGTVGSQQIKAVGDKMQEVGGKISGVGKAILPVSAGVGALGAIATKNAVEFESAFAKVTTLLDDSTTDFEAYKDSIIDASNETGVAVDDLSESIYGSISAGVDSSKAVQFTTEAVKLAKGGFTDTAKAVDVMTTAINGYKLKTEDATKISDMLITTQNLGKTTVDELSSSMGAVIPIASASNFRIDELSASYATLTKNGIGTAEAGTYMKSMLSELTKSGSITDKTLRELSGKGFAELKEEGKSTTEILALLEDNAKKNGKSLKDMFGSVEAGSAALVLMSQGGKEYNEMLEAMQGSAGATEEAFNKMADTPAEKMKILKNELSNLGIEIGAALLPVIEKAVESIRNLVERFSNLSDGTKAVILAIGAVVAVAGPLLVAIGSLITAFGTITAALPALSTALAGVKVAFTAIGGPVTIIMALIGALIAKFVHAYNTSEEFRNKVNAAFAKVKEVVSDAINAVNNKIQDFVNIGKNAVEGLWSGISNSADWLLGKIKAWCGSILNGVKSFFGIHSPSRVFKQIGKYLVEGLGEGIDENGNIAVDEFAKLCDNIIDTADDISTGILSIDEKTGEIIADNTYKNVMDRIDLYYEDRDKRISLMNEASDENIKLLEKDVAATEKATNAKIKLYQQEYRAKVSLIDNETNEQVKALQDELDAMDKAEEQRRRENETQEYHDELNGLYGQLNETSGDENARILEKINSTKAKREETLRRQELSDKKDAIRAEMESAREKATEQKKQLEEELKVKEYNLEQQRKTEIEHMNKVLELMREQVAIKEELEKTQTDIKDKETKLQTQKMDDETKKQTENEISELQNREKELKKSLGTNESNLRSFTPKILEISKGYGSVFLEGFKSTEGEIMSYVDDLCREIRRRIAEAQGSDNGDSDGSHRTGLGYVPFDGYRSILHKGEMVLTQPEADRYRSGGTGKNDTTINNNFYGVKEERTAYKVARETKKTIRKLGLA